MVHQPALTAIPIDRLIQALGTDIVPADLTKLQAQTQILTITPGTSFWQASNGQPGIYIVLAGKVRLFARQSLP